MAVSIRLVDAARQEFTLTRMQKEIFPSDSKAPCDEGFWWLAMDGDTPVAFACLTDVPSWPESGYISRVGVMPSHRGKKLQRRLMRACERKAKSMGWVRIISTTLNNPPSANNFIACGYKTYEPAARWGWTDTIYWLKELKL
jgi:GNAT superfamily N-acetyltransferase